MLIALILQAALAAAAPPAQRPAQPPATIVAEPVAVMLAGFDADGDARITGAEIAAGLRRSFEAIDTARAGTLGFIGYADWAERWLGDRNALPGPFETDTNGDNRIALPEIEAAIAGIVARMDANRDGILSHAELLTIRAAAPRPDRAGARQ